MPRSDNAGAGAPGVVRRRFEAILLALGAMLLAYSGCVWTEARLYQAMEARALDAILAAPERADLRSPLPGSLVGRVDIPRLKLSAIIRAGSDSRTLRLAVGHIPGTALPGETGNIGLAGHRDTFFRRLRDIRDGDEIRMIAAGGTQTFHVTQTMVVDPTDVWVLDATSTPTLTLVTCYPFTYIGSAPRRFIVRAAADAG